MRFAIVALLSCLAPLAAQEPRWSTDFEAAKKQAAKTHKVVLADFTGSDWCGWCRRLDAEVFSKPDFATWAADNVVLLQLDFPQNTPQPPELAEQNRMLAQQFAVKGYPTVVLMDEKGKEIGRLGYERGGAKAWLAKADKILAAHAAPPAAELPWLTDYEAALKKAAAERKVVLADFTGSDWCGWCIKLHDEVFSKTEFAEWAAKNVVLLQLDYPHNKQQPEELVKQNKELVKRFGIEGYPTILFLDATGKELGRSGYLAGGPKAWLAAAEKEIDTTKPKGKRQG